MTINAKLLGGAMYVRLRRHCSSRGPPPRALARAHARLHARRRDPAPMPLTCACHDVYFAFVRSCSSFFQSMCVLGYCLCPLVVAACLCAFLRFTMLQTLLVGGALVWSMKGSCASSLACHGCVPGRMCTARHARHMQLRLSLLVNACHPRAPYWRYTPSFCSTPPLAGWCTFSSSNCECCTATRFAVRRPRAHHRWRMPVFVSLHIVTHARGALYPAHTRTHRYLCLVHLLLVAVLTVRLLTVVVVMAVLPRLTHALQLSQRRAGGRADYACMHARMHATASHTRHSIQQHVQTRCTALMCAQCLCMPGKLSACAVHARNVPAGQGRPRGPCKKSRTT